MSNVHVSFCGQVINWALSQQNICIKPNSWKSNMPYCNFAFRNVLHIICWTPEMSIPGLLFSRMDTPFPTRYIVSQIRYRFQTIKWGAVMELRMKIHYTSDRLPWIRHTLTWNLRNRHLWSSTNIAKPSVTTMLTFPRLVSWVSYFTARVAVQRKANQGRMVWTRHLNTSATPHWVCDYSN